jgi:hypothetical protein
MRTALNNVKGKYKIKDKRTSKSGVRPPNTTIQSWSEEGVEALRHTALCLQRDEGTSSLAVTAKRLSAAVRLVPTSCGNAEIMRGHTFTALCGEYRPPYTITLVAPSGPHTDRRVQVWCSISKLTSASSTTSATLRLLLPVNGPFECWFLLRWKHI